MNYYNPDPPLEPRGLTRKQEQQIELSARLIEVYKEIRQHQSRIDDLKVEAEGIEYELDELE